MFPFAPEAIRRLNQAGVLVVVATNQSGVARGYFPESLVHDVHERMERELAQGGARAILVRTGYGLGELAVDLQRCFVIGDRYTDMELAFNGGARAILVRTGYGLGELAWHAQEWPRQPDVVTENLQTAVDWILKDTQ